jgi:hypothetical protein
MNKYLKIGIIFASIVIVALVADHLATQSSPVVGISIFEPRPVPFDRITIDIGRYYSFIGDMELFYRLKTVLSSINATYIDMYKKLNSEFTIGLILFSLTLLFYALTSNPLLQWIFGYQAFGLGPFAMLPDMFTTLALTVLMYLTMK